MGSKVCLKCGLERDIERFSPSSANKSGYATWCKDCRNAESLRKRIMKRPLPMYHTHKTCPICLKCKPVDDFYIRKSGHVSWCKICYAEKNATWRENNAEKVKKTHSAYAKLQRAALLIKAKTTDPCDGNTHKQCTKCKEIKPLSHFSDDIRGALGKSCYCKPCKAENDRNRNKKKRPPPTYQTHRICHTCGECRLETDFASTATNKMCSFCEEEKGPANLRKREYVLKNIDKVRTYRLEYRNRRASFKIYGHRLPLEDFPTRVDGKLYVNCKNCGKPMRPTISQCDARIAAINKVMAGENNFYCSDICKNSCSLFKVKTIPKTLRVEAKEVRGCTKELKDLAVARQLAYVGYTYCDKCGKKEADLSILHLHHTLPIAEFLKEAHNDDASMLACKECHAGIHSVC